MKIVSNILAFPFNFAATILLLVGVLPCWVITKVLRANWVKFYD